MKTIYIMRHSKADKSLEGITDRQRMLTDTGVARTYMIAQYLIDTQSKIDLVICSPSERTYTTGLIVADKLEIPQNNIQKIENLYLGDEQDALHEISQLYNNADSVLIVGHNPAITHLVNHFAKPMIDSLPTSGIVAFEFNVDSWSEIAKAESRQKFAIWPGML